MRSFFFVWKVAQIDLSTVPPRKEETRGESKSLTEAKQAACRHLQGSNFPVSALWLQEVFSPDGALLSSVGSRGFFAEWNRLDD